MRKLMILAGMLSIGFAYAQEGRVGINTEEPSATLNVKTKADATSPKNLELENEKGKKLVAVLNNGTVGIGTDNPGYALELVASGDSPNERIEDYSYGSIGLRRYRNAGAMGLDFARARRTEENPLPVQKGDGLGGFYVYGYLGDRFITAGGVGFTVGDTPTSNGVIPLQYDISFRNQASGGSMKNGYNSVFRILPMGNVGIGILEPTEKLHIDGNARIKGLSGAGNRPVYADKDGVLKVGAVSGTTAVKVGGAEAPVCDATTVGTINVAQKNISGNDTTVFGFCGKKGDAYNWFYIYGAGITTSNDSTFGSGL